MVVEDQIQLMSQRIGGQRFEALLSRLDDCGSAGDALRLLRSSEFFRGLVERQIDWLETEAQFKASTIDYIIAAHERSAATFQPTEATLTSLLRVLRQRAMLHILWRSFTQRATGLDETLVAISDLADFVIPGALILRLPVLFISPPKGCGHSSGVDATCRKHMQDCILRLAEHSRQRRIGRTALLPGQYSIQIATSCEPALSCSQ